MIDWKKYKDQIIAMAKQGLSSTQIAEVLSMTNEEVSIKNDRQIRKVVSKWKKKNKKVKTLPKILLFDIETAPLSAYMWSKWQKGVSDNAIITDWFILSWSAKWLFDKEVISDVVTPTEATKQDDKRVTKSLWKLLDEADIVIGHNGKKFDVRKANTKFIQHGLSLPSPYQIIDTLLHARKKFMITSNKLDYIAKFLGFEGKMSTGGFDLWVACLEGNKDALIKMNKYCDQDVRVLEDVYLKLRPFIQPHPNLGVYIEDNVKRCPSCAGEELEKVGEYATTVNKYDAYRCKSCESLTRSRRSNLETRENITSSIPR
jgi:transposase-like protein